MDLQDPDARCPSAVFTPEEEARAKANRLEKDRHMGGDHYRVDPSGIDKRWTGEPGEDAFEAWLVYHGQRYRRWTMKAAKDLRDFTVGPHEIDVKIKPSATRPRDYFDCAVKVVQLENSSVNAYVFGTYWFGDRRVVLHGWMTKQEFLARSTVQVERVRNSRTSVFVNQFPNRVVKVHQVRPLSELLAAQIDPELDYFLKVINF